MLSKPCEPNLAVTAVHAGLVAATLATLLANGIVSTQIVEDGMLAALIVCGQLSICLGYVLLLFPIPAVLCGLRPHVHVGIGRICGGHRFAFSCSEGRAICSLSLSLLLLAYSLRPS